MIFDEMACAYFGRRSLAGDLAARYAGQSGGPFEARILATPLKVSAPYAALANGAAGHGEEIDGAHVVGGYPGASIVHAAVAMAERQRATGAELLNAVVLGYDVGVRAQDVVGAALVQGGLPLRESPFPAILSHPAYTRLRPRVTLRGDADLDRDQPEGRGAIVKITTVNGSTYSQRVDHPRGHSQRGGVTWDDLAQKWSEGLPDCDIEKIIGVAQRLEDLESASELVDAFQAGH